MEYLTRRKVLGTVTATGAAIAGCLGGSDAGIEDTDGDGVIDSEDYAPNDPEVQRKSDVLTEATPTMTRATTSTPTSTPTPTTTATATSTPQSSEANSIHATQIEKLTGSKITSYTASSVTVDLQPESLSLSSPEIKLVLGTYTYPRDEFVATGTSDSFAQPSKEVSKTVSLTDGSVPQDERVHHLVFAMDAEESLDTVEGDSIQFLHETDAFRRTETDRIAKDPPPYELADAATDVFERTVIEGAYYLYIEGRTQGTDWWAEWYIWKSAYAQALAEPRGRSYVEYVTYAHSSGEASTVAEIFYSIGEDIGFDDKRMQVEFVVDLIQRLPYVTDDVSKGFDDYPKTVTETITEASGDCEDTAILTAALLSEEPFDYDTVLIQFDGHVGAGIYGTDLPGYYWTYEDRDYYYIETTGEGWGIGDLPEPYQNSEAYVYQV